MWLEELSSLRQKHDEVRAQRDELLAACEAAERQLSAVSTAAREIADPEQTWVNAGIVADAIASGLRAAIEKARKP